VPVGRDMLRGDYSGWEGLGSRIGL
jgi:hypothetical protein